MSLKIAHIINPVNAEPYSELGICQPLVYESMRKAARAINGAELELLSVQYPEDTEVVPSGFRSLSNLSRSILDLGQFDNPRKLPLLDDILQKAFEESDAEWIIYTNADIIVHQDFYNHVIRYIDQGYDAFIINKRIVDEIYSRIEDLDKLFDDPGDAHPGFDCFIFKRTMIPRFNLDRVCLGIPFIGVTLAHNLFVFSERFHLFDDLSITYHIGKEILKAQDPQYYWFNRSAFNRVKNDLKPAMRISNFPYADLNIFNRYKKWIMNPSLFTLMNFKLELRYFFRGY